MPEAFVLDRQESELSIVAMKRVNARGAKGRRKVDSQWKDRWKRNRRQCLAEARLNPSETTVPYLSVGGTVGLDGADAQGPRRRGERRRMVQFGG